MKCPYCAASMTPKNIVLGWRVHVCEAPTGWGHTCGCSVAERVEKAVA